MSDTTRSSIGSWLSDQWLSRSRADLPLVALLVGGHLALVHLRKWPVLLAGVPVGRRPAMYGVAAVVVSLTGTLVSVSVAQYLNGRGERVKALKSRFPKELGRAWRSIFTGSILAAVLFLAAYAADLRFDSAQGTDAGESLGVWLFEAGVLIALVRLLRLAALFGELVDLIVLDDTQPLTDDSITLTPEFFGSKAS